MQVFSRMMWSSVSLWCFWLLVFSILLPLSPRGLFNDTCLHSYSLLVHSCFNFQLVADRVSQFQLCLTVMPINGLMPHSHVGVFTCAIYLLAPYFHRICALSHCSFILWQPWFIRLDSAHSCLYSCYIDNTGTHCGTLMFYVNVKNCNCKRPAV